MLNRLLHAICYQQYNRDNQPKWARNAVRIERPTEPTKESAAA